jgi:hypothetical protein
VALASIQRHALLFVLLVAPSLAATCREETGPPTAASTGTGEGGCPTQSAPAALFTLKVSAMRGPLPEDTTLQVRWSAGDEPQFVLSDPETWKTLEDGSNVVCDLAHDAGPPVDLLELSCELWTSGATEIEVTATGYVTHNETLTPKEIDGCDEPVPSDVEVNLVVDVDAGMP